MERHATVNNAANAPLVWVSGTRWFQPSDMELSKNFKPKSEAKAESTTKIAEMMDMPSGVKQRHDAPLVWVAGTRWFQPS